VSWDKPEQYTVFRQPVAILQQKKGRADSPVCSKTALQFDVM